MIDFEKELALILQKDPLGLLDIKHKASSVISADDRLISSFEEINSFVREHGTEPAENRDISERRLFSRLKGIRADIDKTTALLAFDHFGLLKNSIVSEIKEINSVEDILNDDVLGLLRNDTSDNDIFTLKNVAKTMDMPEQVARRKPCKDFDAFEALFKQCHADLLSHKNELRKFTGEQQITVGHFFILHGVMVYVAGIGDKSKKRGKVNAKLRCIFENGTESNMLLRSLATSLYMDESGRRVLPICENLFDEPKPVTANDMATGTLYVLRSLSKVPKIKAIENLYKIGFSSQSVEQRIQNAEQEPTYLMAKVKLVSEYQTFNLNPQKLELLLHTFFADCCLNLDVFDSDGKRHTPREWFIVSLHNIETAIQLLINGEIVNYRYDGKRQEIVSR
jgi:hypothetical protein